MFLRTERKKKTIKITEVLYFIRLVFNHVYVEIQLWVCELLNQLPKTTA